MKKVSPLRILFLSPVGAVGGAERVMLTAIAGIQRELPDALVRVLGPADGPLQTAVTKLGAEFSLVPLPAALARLGDSQLRASGKWRKRAGLAAAAAGTLPGAMAYSRKLRAEIARFQPDLVHSNGIKTHLLSYFAVPGTIPVVWHLHDFYGLRPLAAFLLRRCRSRVRAGIAISQAVADDTRLVLPGVPIKLLRNAIDLNHFSPGPGEDLDRLAGSTPAPRGTLRVGLVATYARWKGHELFLEAAKLLAAARPNLPLRWLIVGGPIYQTSAQYSEGELRGLVQKYGLQDRVGFIPFQLDTAGIYRGLDIVVHASTLPEPFGLTVAEAMACGRPVIVSASGGAGELFTHGHDGLGVKTGDAAALAAAITQLAEHAELRVQLGIAARANAERNFDDVKYGRELLELYRQLVHRK